MRTPSLRFPALSAGIALCLLASSAAAQGGDWRLESSRGNAGSVQLTLLLGGDAQTSLTVHIARLRGLTGEGLEGASQTAKFVIEGDAGTVSFEGSMGGGQGAGEYRFSPNRAFDDSLRRDGVRGVTGSFDLLRLAIRGITRADVANLLTTMRRYDDRLPDAGEIVRFWNHDVDAATIADLGDAGLRELDASQIIRLVNHDVDGAFVRSARARGYADLDAEGLIRLKNHKGEFRGDRAGRIH
jgi:hypothetical protein